MHLTMKILATLFTLPVAVVSVVNPLTTTLQELTFLLDSAEISGVNLTRQYLSQISVHARLNALLDVAPRGSVLDESALRDYERRTGRKKGVLHGVPVVVGDTIATEAGLGMGTTAGSWALVGAVVGGDAGVVQRLRRAGAVVLAKANMSVWSGFRASPGKIPPGWSARGGQTTSAYVASDHPDSNPGGASAGAAVAVSAGFAPIAIATETDGGIIVPASRAALYAIKPAVGKVPMDGVVPVGPSMDSVGVMGKSAWDIAATLEVMVGEEAKYRYLDAIEEGWEGLRVGVLRGGGFWDRRVVGEQIIEESLAAVRRMGEFGATIVDPVYMPSIPEVLTGPGELTVLSTEFKESLATYFSTLQNTTHHTLSDIIAFNEQHLPLEMPPGHCCQDIFLAANATNGTTSSAYLSALSRLRTLSRDHGITFATRKYKLDVLVVPADSPRSTALSAASGWPVATVPVGVLKNSGRPFGLAVFTSGEDGKGEERLMRVSGQWWKVCGDRAVPAGF